MKKAHYENGEDFTEDAYTARGFEGFALCVLGWETEPDEDTEWSGYENRTGKVAVVMIGDDRIHAVDPEDLKPLSEDGFCRECGQTGCFHGR